MGRSAQASTWNKIGARVARDKTRVPLEWIMCMGRACGLLQRRDCNTNPRNEVTDRCGAFTMPNSSTMPCAGC